MSRRALSFEQGSQMRDAADAIGIRKQAVMKIVDVQDGELVDGALPATAQQKEDGSEKSSSAWDQLRLSRE